MIVVVADTSPLNYLVQIDCQHVLPTLFERVFIPGTVLKELDHPGAPVKVRAFLHEMPKWIVVYEIRGAPDPALYNLDPGEREAIQLAEEQHADLILMDDKLGVRFARNRGFAVTGTLGVLVQAARRELVDLETVLARLDDTDFRLTPALLEQAKKHAREKA